MKLEDLVVESYDIEDDGKHVRFMLSDKDGNTYIAYCAFYGRSWHFGRTYRDGLAVSPAENGFTCDEIELEYAYDYNTDDGVEIEGDFNELCDELSFYDCEH